MSQDLIAQIQEVSSASSSSSDVSPLNTNLPNYKMVHFHPDFQTIGTQKISQFIQLHKLSLQHFWKSDKYYFGYNDIKQMCENIGLRLEPEDEVDLKHELFHTNLVISIFDFKDKIKSWRYYTTSKINDFLQKRINILNDCILKSNITIQKKSQRPLSSISYNKKTQIGSSQNKSIQYLKLQKVKMKEQENKLNQAINKAKNQEEYQILIKMGQANDMNRELEPAVYTYRAYKNAQGNLKVKVFNLDIFQKQLNLEQFQREYNFIKKRYNEIKKVNVWDMLASNSNNTHGHKSTKILGESRDSTHLSKKNIKTVERDKKKKKMVEILTETINLTNIFKQQLRILKSQGITKKQ